MLPVISIIKRVVAAVVILSMSYVLITTFYGTPTKLALVVSGGAGVLLALVGTLSNLHRSSPIRVGTINRAAFYGVVVFLTTCMIYLNTRIDQIMITLVK